MDGLSAIFAGDATRMMARTNEEEMDSLRCAVMKLSRRIANGSLNADALRTRLKSDVEHKLLIIDRFHSNCGEPESNKLILECSPLPLRARQWFKRSQL